MPPRSRGGEYGKGFAVVAEEVRNLATLSAEAVRETLGLAEISGGPDQIEQVTQGTSASAEESAASSESGMAKGNVPTTGTHLDDDDFGNF